jgi:hypothetical protein
MAMGFSMSKWTKRASQERLVICSTIPTAQILSSVSEGIPGALREGGLACSRHLLFGFEKPLRCMSSTALLHLHDSAKYFGTHVVLFLSGNTTSSLGSRW